MQVLLASARLRMPPPMRSRVRSHLAGQIDLRRLLRMAMRHKMAPLLGHHLADHPDLVPARVLQYLAQWNGENARRMLQSLADLIHLRALLADAGIESIPYKGPTLGAQIYGSAALRQSNDLDLLVEPDDVLRAREVLLTAGYTPRHVLSGGGARFMVRSRYSEAFDHGQRTRVELHWAFTNGDIGFDVGARDLTPNTVPVSVGGVSLPGFGREDLLLTLCVHGSKHRWDRLEWLAGLGEAIRGASGIDWDALVARATRLGVRRMLLLGLLLVHDLLEAPVPARILARARADAAVVRAAGEVPRFLVEEAADPDAASLPTDLFRYELRERWRDRVRFILYRATTPSQPERWSAVTVGNLVLPVHALARPFHVLRKLGPAVRAVARRGAPR
jgi:hypothetical protein